MKFKNKIIISFCIIIFVPIFLAMLVLFSMQHIQMKAIEQTYGVEGEGYSYFSNSVQLLSRFTREIYQELHQVSDNQPEKLQDEAYLEKVNQQLEEGTARVRVLPCEEVWHGVTYREDLASVKEAICALKAAGVYEERLWPD